MKGIDPKWTMYLGLLVAVERAIGHGTVSLTNLIPEERAPYVTSWCNFLAFVGTSIMTYQAAMSLPLPRPMVNTPIAPTAKVAILLAALGAGLFAMPDDASAQVELKTPQQIVNDIKSATGQVTSPTSSKPGACDVTLFANLTVANVVTDIQNCIGSVVAGGAAPFVADIKVALQSANDAKDGTAVACLGPALAIATAAMGTPAGADCRTPAVYPGPILIFQKYREFVTAGGPSNCKTAVQSTINGTVASAL
jgi:hypothetical protein